MTNQTLLRRKNSLRLRGYDYKDPGFYFITICTERRKCLFGNILDGEMILNIFGLIAEMRWQWIEWFYPLELGSYIVMPNHLHGIIAYDKLMKNSIIPHEKTKPKSLGDLIGAFKSVTTKWINIIRDTPRQKIWQRNFHDRIIRNQKELQNILKYIENNPMRWELDSLNPDR